MVWILMIILLLLIIFIGFCIEKKIGLLSLYGIIWTIVIFLCGLSLYELIEYSNRVYLIVLIGTVSFTIGYIIFYKCNIKGFSHYKIKYLSINQNFLLILLFFSLIFYLIQSSKVINLILSGIPLSTIRYSFYTQGKIMNELETIISTWITTPIVFYLIVPINVWNYFGNNGKYRKTIFILSIINIVLFLFVSQAKQNLIYYGMSLLIAINQFDLDKDKKKKIYKLIILLLIVVVVFNGIRNGMYNLSFIYTYVGTPMNLLDYWTNYIDKFNLLGYGTSALYGIMNIPISILNLFGFIDFSYIQHVGEYLNYIISTGIEVFKGVGPRNNVYVTNFLFFYFDGRLFGVFIESLIYGSFIGNYVKKYKYNKESDYKKIQYNIIGVGLLYSFISWPFFNTAYCVSFIILRLCSKNHKQIN